MANISLISPSEFTSLSYDEKDINLIPSFEVDTSFGEGSYIEYYIFDLNKSLISVNYDYDSTHPSGGAKYYKGGDDSFTLVQLMAT